MSVNEVIAFLSGLAIGISLALLGVSIYFAGFDNGRKEEKKP